MEHTQLRFNGLTETAAYIRKSPSIAGTSAAGNSAREQWDLNLGYEGSIATLEKGGRWPEGAALMRKAHIEQQAAMKTTPMPELMRKPAGFAPCVAAYLQGNPNQMYRRTPIQKPTKPIIKVGINVTASAATKANQLVNLGAAWMSVVQELEAKGYRCEVEVFCLGGSYEQNTKKKRDANWFDAAIKIKQPDQPFNPVACAFMMAHPAAFRRIMFKLAETKEEWTEYCEYGYGSCLPSKLVEAEARKRYDLVSPLQHGNKRTKTPVGALDYVRRIVTKQLKDFK